MGPEPCLRIRPGIFDFEPDLGLKRSQTKPQIPGMVPTDRHTTIPKDSGPISSCFDDEPKHLNREITQPRLSGNDCGLCGRDYFYVLFVFAVCGRIDRVRVGRWEAFPLSGTHIPAVRPKTPRGVASGPPSHNKNSAPVRQIELGRIRHRPTRPSDGNIPTKALPPERARPKGLKQNLTPKARAGKVKKPPG